MTVLRLKKWILNKCPTKLWCCTAITLYILTTTSEVSSNSICPNATPGKCICNGTEEDGQSYLQIFCIDANLTTIPDNLPNIPRMKIEGNNIPILGYISRTSLKNLFLDNNGIRYITGFAFKDLSNLEHLSLQNNKISGLSNNTFYGLTGLRTLYLRKNRLYELENDTFSGSIFKSLNILVLADCKLITIAAGAFNGATTLAMLDLSNNMLTAPMQYLGYLKIDTLNLSSNHLENLAGSPFRGLKFLDKLSLSNNQISNLTASDFKGLLGLTLLRLDNNSISSIDISTFKETTELTQLDLSSNHLKTMSVNCLSWNSLDKLYIYDNPWHCSCQTQWLYNQQIVIQWNLDSNLRCASPVSVAGKHVFTVNDKIFDCPHGHKVTTGLILGIVIAVLFTVVGSILLYKLVVKKKIMSNSRSRGNGVCVTTTSSYSRVQDSRELFESCVESNIT